MNRRPFAVPAPHQYIRNRQDTPVPIFVRVVPRRCSTDRDGRRPESEYAGQRAPLVQADADTTLKFVPCPTLRERPIRQRGEAVVVVAELAREAGW